MKILKVRRGFTTNSSASSEWVPPPWNPNATPSATGSGQTASQVVSSANNTASGASSPLVGNSLLLGGLLAGLALVMFSSRALKTVFSKNSSDASDVEQ